MHSPSEQNRRGNLIKLQPGPERFTINPAVLRKAAVRSLNSRQPDQGTDGRVDCAAREQRRCALHQIAGPDQMVATHVIIPFGLSPGNAHRRDQGPLENLIFVGQEHTMAQPIGPAVVGSLLPEIVGRTHGCPLPLPDIIFPMKIERCRK